MNLNAHLEQPMGPEEWLARAERFFLGWNEPLLRVWGRRGVEVRLEDLDLTDRSRLRCYLAARHQPDGRILWVVQNEDFILAPVEEGYAFCIESLPSNRSKEWLDRSRFETHEAAITAFKAFCGQSWSQYGT